MNMFKKLQGGFIYYVLFVLLSMGMVFITAN